MNWAQSERISVIIPALDEAGNIGPLIEETFAAIPKSMLAEIIVVDDCSKDRTAAEVGELMPRHPQLRLLRHLRRSGQSSAIRTGVRFATGDLIATIDGDGQNDPADIPRLAACLVVKAPVRRSPAAFAPITGGRLEAPSIEVRQLAARRPPRRRLSGYRMRHQGLLSPGLPRSAILLRHAPLLAGNLPELRPRRRLPAGQRPPAQIGPIEIHKSRPRPHRHLRPDRRALAPQPHAHSTRLGSEVNQRPPTTELGSSLPRTASTAPPDLAPARAESTGLEAVA